MKKLISLFTVACLMSVAAPVSAQLKFGIKAGANFADLNIDDYKTNRAAGWFVGPTAEFLMPVIGIGLDASLLYSRVNSEVGISGLVDKKYKLDYLSVPVNIKYKLGLPVIKPFIYAGPEFNLRVHDNFSDIWDDFEDLTDRKSFKSRAGDMQMNVGGGIEFFNKLEVFVNYNFALTNTVKHIDSKANMWRVGGTLYF